MVFFNCTTKVNTKEPLFKYPFDKGMTFESDNKASIYRYYIEYNGLNPLWNKVFHRSLIDTDEDYEKKSYVTNGTDRFQSTPIISKAKRIVYLDEVLYFYRTQNNNASIVHTFKQTAFL